MTFFVFIKQTISILFQSLNQDPLKMRMETLFHLHFLLIAKMEGQMDLWRWGRIKHRPL